MCQPVGKAYGRPIVYGGGLYRAQGRGYDFEVGIGFTRGLHHVPIAVCVQMAKMRVVAGDVQAQTGRKVLLVAQHHVHMPCDFTVDLLCASLAADALPQGRAIV
jgi:hypothetical protein